MVCLIRFNILNSKIRALNTSSMKVVLSTHSAHSIHNTACTTPNCTLTMCNGIVDITDNNLFQPIF